MTGEYPKREKFYSHRFCRTLAKSAAAQEIGAEACWMLTVIAHQEDAKKYKGAVTYYNEQIMPLCDFRSHRRLIAVRERAIKAGWLHYEPGGKSRAGKYWTKIPVHLNDLPDTPMDESSDGFCASVLEAQMEAQKISHGSGASASVSASVAQVSAQGKRKCQPSLPIPIPDPIPNPKYIRARFDSWWVIYPKKVAKLAAEKAYPKALSRIATERGLTLDEAILMLNERTMQFAQSGKATGTFCPHPATFLNEGRYFDDQQHWRESNGRSGPGQTHDPVAVGVGDINN